MEVKRPHWGNHYINRRVEFRVSKAEDNDMARPEGPEAGDCHKKRMKRAGSVKLMMVQTKTKNWLLIKGQKR
ncbi:MAG: hypothetical protein IPJ43_12645 [Saprospiraceae bacterium]|nr:hypothetical protein [Saprospiraceae bacterium]